MNSHFMEHFQNYYPNKQKQMHCVHIVNHYTPHHHHHTRHTDHQRHEQHHQNNHRNQSPSPKLNQRKIQQQSLLNSSSNTQQHHHTMPLPHNHLNNHNHNSHLNPNNSPLMRKSPSQTNPAQYQRISSSANNHHLRIPPHQMRGTVISDISFESGLSDDYALPPDAVSESTCPMDASMPSLLMRQSYVDSPSKKLESLEKVSSTSLIIRLV